MKTSKNTAGSNTKGTPLLSVIVPVYNMQAHLRRCLDSLCTQNYRNLEIICVDDGSTDNSLAILQEYAAKDRRVRVVAQANGGVSSARNAGLDAATGEWVTGMDPDDYLMPGAYKRLMAYTKGDVDLVVYDVRVEAHPGSGREGDVEIMQQYMHVDNEGERAMDADCLCDFGVFVNKLYRRELIEKNKLRFNTSLRTCEDVCFYICYGAYAKKVAYCSTPCYVYVLHRGTLSVSEKNGEFEYENYRRFLSHIFQLYTELDLATTYERMFEVLITVANDHIRRWAYASAKAIEWRHGLLEVTNKFHLLDYPATAAKVSELTEQVRCAETAFRQLKECAEQAAQPSPQGAELIHVAIPVDAPHAGQAALLAQTLHATTAAGRAVCVHFICDDAGDYICESLQKLASENLHVLIHELPKSRLHHLPKLGGAFPRSAYLKMSLPWLLPDVERVLTLSPGVLLNGALPALDSVDMEGMPVAVMHEPRPAYGKEAAQSLTIREYVSSSAILFDLQRMREQEWTKTWVAASMFHEKCLVRPEEDSFNIAFQGRMAKLPESVSDMLLQATDTEMQQAASAQPLLLPLNAERLLTWAPPPYELQLPSGTTSTNHQLAPLASQYQQLRSRYHYYKFMSKLTWGQRRKHYEENRDAYHNVLRQIRQYFNTSRREWGIRL